MEEHIEAVQRMQDYIQENLNKEITMADLARASMYSPWYSYRLFVQLLNNPYEYSLSPVPIYLFKPYGVKYAKIRKQKTTGSIAKRWAVMFQGEPFEEADFDEAIQQIWDAAKKYNPEVVGLCWDDANPRIQLEPVGTRGYIELYPAKDI